MTIDSNSLHQVATLAKISLDNPSLDAINEQINEVLDLVDQLQKVDTTNITPMAHPLDAVQRLRADVVTETNQRETLLANAPEHSDGLFLVPRVVE